MKSIISVFILVLSIGFISASMPNSDGGYEIGDTADNFSLMNVDGEMVSLDDFEEAKGFVIIFTCNTCPYSKLYEDRIISMHKELALKGFHVIAINPNDPKIKPGDSYGEMKSRAREKSFPFPYLFDEQQEIFPKFGAKSTPHAFVLDKDRIVKYIGAIDDNPRDPEAIKDNYVLDAIAAVEIGEEPKINYTKAIGCGIKSNKYKKLKGIKKQNKVNKYRKVKPTESIKR